MKDRFSELSIAEMRARLLEAEETLDAIRNGDVDALVVGGPAGQQVYTLHNADRPYRVLVEQMQEGAVTLGRDGSILYCNDRFAEMVKENREQLIGAQIGRFFFGDFFVNTFRSLIEASFRSTAVAEFEMLTTTSASIPVNVSLVDLIVEADAPAVVCAVITDLSLIRRRSDELAAANSKLAIEIEERRRAQDSLQLTLDAAGMGSWDLDLRQNTAERTLRHDQLFGYETMLPKWSLQTAIDHILPEDKDTIQEAFDQSSKSGRLDFEARVRRADNGSIRWLHITGQTFYEGDEPIRIAGVVADVTDRRAVEERIRQSQKIDAMGQLTGGVAHDFNNLLMVISGGLDMLNRHADPDRRNRILTGMRRAVERGTGLSRQLLAFSREQALRPQPINLLRQISGMRELLDRSLRGDIHVTTELDDDLWPIEVDPGEFELVLLNLAVNARDAMPNGGSITIRGTNLPNYRDASLSGDFVRLSVVDTGTGMPPEVVARVFEPFYTTKDIGKGSGLGLAQTHGFVQSSGGGIRIDSTPGVGTEIHLLLPRTSKTPVQDQDKHPIKFGDDSENSLSTGHVLVVEDDNEVAALTIEMIEHLGYETTRVSGAEAALGALANARVIDLVFSDVMMPGLMNGVDLAREIRLRRPELPVLLTSGHADAAKRQADIEGVKILPKPFRLDDLANAFEMIRAATRSGDKHQASNA